MKAIFKQTFNFKVLFHQMVMLSGLDKFHSIDHHTKKIQSLHFSEYKRAVLLAKGIYTFENKICANINLHSRNPKQEIC